MNPLSAAGVSSRSGSPVPQRAAAVESSVAGGGGGASAELLSSLERTQASTPVAPHVFGSHAETRADAATLREAEVVGGGGAASA